MSTTNSARNAADRVQDSRPIHGAARVGFAVNGIIHILIGFIALGVAFGDSGRADQDGALAAIAQQPGGVFLLWVIAIGLFGLGLFYVLEAFIRRGSGKHAWTARAKDAGKAIVYLALGFTALQAAMGTKAGNSEGKAENFTAKMLQTPGGVFLIVAIAIGVIAIGIYFINKGAKKKFLHDIDVPVGRFGQVTRWLGTAGYIAKGVAIVIAGILLAVAAFTTDAKDAAGLDGALKALGDLPFGTVLLTIIALGLILFGLYSIVRAKQARLD